MDISENKFYKVMYLYGNEEKMENEASDKKKDIKRGVQDGIPIALGYLSVSFACGIMAVSAGLTPWQAILISVANVTSAGQFAGVEIMAACGGLVEMALTQLVINIRYALMSLSLAQKVDDTFKKPTRMAVSFCVTDEIFAVSVSRNKTVSKYYMLGIISVSYNRSTSRAFVWISARSTASSAVRCSSPKGNISFWAFSSRRWRSFLLTVSSQGILKAIYFPSLTALMRMRT